MQEETVDALIEIPMGSQNKYEVNEKTKQIYLDRVLYSAMFYPAEYGYIIDTLGLDGDPMDVLVFTTYPTFPGCHIMARVIGGMDMTDSGYPDTKILAINDGDPRFEHVKTMDDLSPHYLKEISNFFSTYKELQEGKHTSVNGWVDKETAIAQVQEARVRFQSGKH